MSPLLEPIIAQALVDGLAQRNRQGGKKELFLIFTASLLAAAGALLLVYALYGGLLAWLEQPPLAALAAGVATLLAALLFGLGAVMAGKKRRERQTAQIPAMAESIQKSLLQIGHELEEPERENPAAALLIAGLAGFLSGKHIH